MSAKKASDNPGDKSTKVADAASGMPPVPQTTSLIAYILVNYRWVFVCLFLLPLSFLYDILYNMRSKIIFYLNSAPKKHAERVRQVQDQVRCWIKNGRKMPMCTARPGWQNMSYRRGMYKKTMSNISINMMDILEVNTSKKFVRVEPLVTMGQLSSTLSPLGWALAIVPEMDDLTVGGLVMGTGIETSSHRYGLFQHICLSYELVVSDGSVIHCSKDENPDLFYSIPWSYGTLGFLTAVEIQIIPIKSYIKLQYHPITSLEEFSSHFEKETKLIKKNDFIEGILFDLNNGIIMTGQMTNTYELNKLNQIGKWYKPWFFKHIQNKLKKNSLKIEYIPIRDYYHRHSRSIFWEIQDIIPFGNNFLFRLLFGWLIPPKISLLKLTQNKSIKELYDNYHFIQDILIPIKKLKKSIELIHQNVKIYPLWICPFQLPSNPGMLKTSLNDPFYVDIGVYGVPHVNHFHPIHTTRRIESFVRENNGFQMLYADSYMTENEFEIMFDHSLYDKIRKIYQCDGAFPRVYGKVSRAVRD